MSAKIQFHKTIYFFWKIFRPSIFNLFKFIFANNINSFYNNTLWPTPCKNWLNMGYWKHATDYPTAASSLAMLLTEQGEFQSKDSILDVGNGYGEQNIQWAKKYGATITALNINPHQVEIGNQRVEECGLKQKISIQQGSASHLPFLDDRFTKVVALESAFHFNTREGFFHEAHRVLKPGGLLCMADIIFKNGNESSDIMTNTLQILMRKKSCIPEDNVYNQEVYISKCSAAGFTDIKILSIKKYVFPGWVRCLEMTANNKKDIFIGLLPEDELENHYGITHYKNILGIDDYIIVIARKAG